MKSVYQVEIDRIELNSASQKSGESDELVCRKSVEDFLAIEEPLQIQICRPLKKTVAVTMRTPGDDINLALGFLFTEGIVSSPNQIIDCKPCGESHNVVSVAVSDDVNLDQMDQRNFFATSSCGVCGKASLDSIRSISSFDIKLEQRIDRKFMLGLSQLASREQQLFHDTGGIHAAAIFNDQGRLLHLSEDVGRHNAVDKLIGHSFCNDLLPLDNKILFLSGRASFELIQKAAMAAIPIVAAVGAPSSLAVELAKELGITLIGFLSHSRYNIYSHSQRLGIKTC